LYKKRTNKPYISGDSIASLVEYVAYGKSKNKMINKKKLKKAKTIFVYSDKLYEFLENYSDYIFGHTLVTGNGDTNFDFEISMPKSIKLWLCQNNSISDRKNIRTLPIGIENLKLGRTGIKTYYKKHNVDAIKNKILVPPMSPSNPVRAKLIFECMKHPDLFVVERQMLTESNYFDLTRKYRFVLCLEGNGYENHRIWETLYQGSFPVMLKTKWSKTLSYLDLPILFFEKISDLNSRTLFDFIETNKGFNPDESECLWTPYWADLIQNESKPEF